MSEHYDPQRGRRKRFNPPNEGVTHLLDDQGYVVDLIMELATNQIAILAIMEQTMPKDIADKLRPQLIKMKNYLDIMAPKSDVIVVKDRTRLKHSVPDDDQE